MDQCGRMKQLNHRGSDIASMIYLSKHSCSHKDKGRVNFLAFLAKQVMDDPVQQPDIAGNLFLKKVPENRQTLLHEFGNLLYRTALNRYGTVFNRCLVCH